MATISFTLSDAAIAEVVDALCTIFLYSDVDSEGNPNPETRAQFARRMMRRWLVSNVKQYRQTVAVSGAVAGVDQTDPDIT